MTIEQLNKFQMYLNAEIIGIESKIISPDNFSEYEFKAYLLRYTFLFRLKSKINQYCLNETDFFKDYKAQHGLCRIDLEAETIFNKFFRSRMNRSYESIIESINKEWYHSHDI